MKVDFVQIWASLFVNGIFCMLASVFFFAVESSLPTAARILGFSIFALAGIYSLYLSKKLRNFFETLSSEQERILLYDHDKEPKND